MRLIKSLIALCFVALGIVFGAVIAVVMTRVFLEGFPVLNKNLFEHPELRLTEAHEIAQLGSWEWHPATNKVTWSGSDSSKMAATMSGARVVRFTIRLR